eukprot:gb/GEZN01005859.1/.p1 GENE.gb/GEZN01005859.1/~~gb/GEZN01005859.1/.p1  ORF type:complete len:546 (-),score=97.52 gb/GEZN01005859.1/:61-1698(-)
MAKRLPAWLAAAIAITVLAWLPFLFESMGSDLALIIPYLPSSIRCPYLPIDRGQTRSKHTWKYPPDTWQAVTVIQMREQHVAAQRATLKQLAAQAQPVLLRGLPSVQAWPALSKWSSWQHLSEGLGASLSNVLHCSTLQRAFVYHDLTRPLHARQPNVQWNAPATQEASVNTQQFLWEVFAQELAGSPSHAPAPPPHSPLPNSSSPNYVGPPDWYFSASLDTFPFLLSDVSPWKALVSPLLPTGYDSGFVRTNLWIAAENVSARCHYDADHNLFVQVLGQKRMLLFPPQAWPGLSVFPHTHPVARHSRLDFRLSSSSAFDALGPFLSLGREVFLSPGDALFLPAFWWHFVETRSASISVNFYVPSTEKQVFQRLLSMVAKHAEPASPEHLFLFTELVLRRVRHLQNDTDTLLSQQVFPNCELKPESPASECLVGCLLARFDGADPFLQRTAQHSLPNRFCQELSGQDPGSIPEPLLQLAFQVAEELVGMISAGEALAAQRINGLALLMLADLVEEIAASLLVLEGLRTAHLPELLRQCFFHHHKL